MILDYNIPTLVPYINWAYFYFAWQLKEPGEQQRIRKEAEAFLEEAADRYRVHAAFQLCSAHSEGDDIIIRGEWREERGERYDESEEWREERGERMLCLPMLRQQSGNGPYLCLSDFIHPRQDHIGVFATSTDHGMESDFNHDPYQKMMAQLLADRLAEAAAEYLHEQVRKKYWGYAPDEQLSIEELHQERFIGIRPAIGYPSLPDASINFLLDRLLDFSKIGIRLTESGAMRPHASVSGLMIAHPQARYFAVGKIGKDQLADYARRRGIPLEMAKKFLAANIS